MIRRFPKTWYEWMAVLIAAFVFISQGSLSLLSLLNMPQSILLPSYIYPVMICLDLPVLIGALFGLTGIVCLLLQKKTGWPLLMIATAFFIYLHLYYAFTIAYADIRDYTVFVYLLALLSLVAMCLQKPVRLSYSVNMKRLSIALTITLALMGVHAFNIPIGMFITMHLH